MFVIKLAYRSILKNKKLALLNTLCLTVGIVSFLVLDDYATFHGSFDEFHGEDVYRVRLTHFYDDSEEPEASSYPAIGAAMKADFTDVEDYVTLTRKSLAKGTFTNRRHGMDEHYYEEKVFFASKSFFNVLAYKLIAGDPTKCLERPYTAVISASAAKRYFGNDKAIGQTITRNGSEIYEVTGVFEDFPENTHLKADILLSFKTFERLRPDVTAEHAWSWWMFYTYIKVQDGIEASQIEERLNPFIRKYLGEDGDKEVNFYLQPIKNIHLTSHFSSEAEVNVREENVDILKYLGYFILVLSLINYVNLSSSRSLERSKEVGVKKVLGSKKRALIRQFLMESLLMGFVSFLLSLTLISFLKTSIETITGSQLILWSSLDFWLKSIVIIAIGSICAGLYPAFVLSSFNPLVVITGRFINSIQGANLRRALVLFQFIITFGIFSATLIVSAQLKYMTDKNINADIDGVLYSRVPSNGITDLSREIEFFKQELLKNPEINSVTACSSVPGKETWGAGGVRRFGASHEDATQLDGIDVDDDFLQVFGLSVLHGRFFDQSRPNESNTLMLSERAVIDLGYGSAASAVGERLSLWGDTLEVVGIVSNYHHLSPKTDVQPLFFMLTEDYEYLSFRVTSGEMTRAIEIIETVWANSFPGNPVELRFVDADYQDLYEEELKLQQTVGLFSVVSIIIAVLGIYGLSAFNLLRRMKEISVRKVLGADKSSLIILLSKEYMLMILVAGVVSSPLIYLFFRSWIENYAYQIGFSISFIIIPMLVVFFVIALTVFYQILRAARVNPAITLSSE